MIILKNLCTSILDSEPLIKPKISDIIEWDYCGGIDQSTQVGFRILKMDRNEIENDTTRFSQYTFKMASIWLRSQAPIISSRPSRSIPTSRWIPISRMYLSRLKLDNDISISCVARKVKTQYLAWLEFLRGEDGFGEFERENFWEIWENLWKFMKVKFGGENLKNEHGDPYFLLLFWKELTDSDTELKSIFFMVPRYFFQILWRFRSGQIFEKSKNLKSRHKIKILGKKCDFLKNLRFFEKFENFWKNWDFSKIFRIFEKFENFWKNW